MNKKLFVLGGSLFLCNILIAQDRDFVINDTSKNAAQLSELSIEELMNIQVVTASGYQQTATEAPSTITVITAKEIAERGYEQLEDALRDVPGIDMIHINGYAPTLIYFRGMYGAENLRALFMIDGIAENNIIGSNDMAGPAYSLHNVDHIEIIWGPASALYGANAFGGVINIITKKGGDINGVHAEVGEGTFNTNFKRISIGAKQDKFEFAAAGAVYNTDGPKFTNRDPLYDASFVQNAVSFNGYIAYNTNKTKTSIGYRTYQTPMGWGTYANSPTTYLGLPPQGNQNNGLLGILSRDIDGAKPGIDDSYLRTFFIQNEFKPTEKLSIVSRITYRETGTGDDSYVYVTVDGKKLIRANVTTYSNSTIGDLTANYALSKMHKFSAGFEYQQDNVEKGSRASTFDTTVYLIDGKDSVQNLHSVYLPRVYDIRNNFGGYFQYILSTNILGKTDFTFGVRDDYNSYFGNTASPRAVIVNKPNDNFTFKFQFGKAFRAPTNLEIYQAPSNFPLKTEKNLTYEVNAIYTGSKKFRFQLNAFHNHLTDVIVISNLSGLTENKNPGIIDVTGLEGICNMSVSKTVSAFLNFTLNDARGKNLITNIERDVPAIAKVKGNAGVTMYLENFLTLTVSGNMVGSRPVQSTNPYGPVAGYFLANCVISTTRLFNNHITVSFNIKNLFNTTWLDPGFRTADGLVFSTALEQPGRTGLFKVTADFNQRKN